MAIVRVRMENNYLLSEEFSNKYNIVPEKIKDGRFYAYCLSVDKNISDKVEKIVKMLLNLYRWVRVK